MNALEMKKKLATGEIVNAKSVMLYGPAKSGKTLAAMKMAKKYKVLYLDGENGGEVMLQLPDEYLANIEWVQISDTRDKPNFVEFMMRFAEGESVKLCEEHGNMTCSECVAARKPFKTYNIRDYPATEWVIVSDSLTQMSLSADWFITNKQKLADGSKFTFDEWRLKGFYLERILGAIQTSKFNWIVITHEQGIEQEDGTEKLTPSGGTKNFARNNAKYFGSVIYLEIAGGKHTMHSQTTDKPKAITGNRPNLDVKKYGILSLFDPAEKLRIDEEEKKTPEKKSVGLKLGSK